jgi:hypothetical protein
MPSRPNCWPTLTARLRRILQNAGGLLGSSLWGAQFNPPKRDGVAKAGQFRRISNRNKVRIEIVPTYRKQRRATNSNRNSFRGSSPFNPDANGISGQAKSEERSFRLRPASAELRRGSLPNSGGEQKSRGASLPSAALGAGRMTT